MALYIANSSSETINVCLILFDPSCTTGGVPFRKVAWWVIGPGQTIVPDALNVDLTTINRYEYIYAYSASGDMIWQSSENRWALLSSGAAFSQCAEDNTPNMTRWADFEQMDFAGHSNMVAYIGPSTNPIVVEAPAIGVDPGEGAFYVYGSGFVPGSSVNITYNYEYASGLTTNSGSPDTANVFYDGSFSTIVYVSTLLYSGTLAVEVVDNGFPALNATVTESF